MPTVHPVRAALEHLRIPAASLLMVHASFRRLSAVGLDPRSVVAEILAFLRDGTLAMPTMSWRSVNPDNPLFDERETPGVTGVLSEVFRQEFATTRSLHPTHSAAARGPLAEALVADHWRDDTPCSDRSPWGRLAEMEAQILLLDVGMERCTAIHHVEEKIAPALYLQPADRAERYICRDRVGREFPMLARRHLKLQRDFEQFATLLQTRGQIHQVDLAGATLTSFSARHLIAAASETLHQRPDAIIA